MQNSSFYFHFNRIMCKVHNHKMKFYYIDVVILLWIQWHMGPSGWNRRHQKKNSPKDLKFIRLLSLIEEIFKIHKHKLKFYYIDAVDFLVISVTYGLILMRTGMVESRPRNSPKVSEKSPKPWMRETNSSSSINWGQILIWFNLIKQLLQHFLCYRK